MRELIRVLAALSILPASVSVALAHSHVQTQPVKPPLPLQFLPLQPSAQVQTSSPATISPTSPKSKLLVATVTFADIGFKNGIRFANLGGQRELFVSLPQDIDLSATELTLVLDDLSAHEARRNVEVLVNDRSVAAIPLDGKGAARTIHIPLGKTKAREGFFKVAFVYGGAATQDRCIDVRYVGDSLTVRPESGIQFEFDPDTLHDVATIAALLPRDVSVLLPSRRLSAPDFAAALTVARSLAATGRRASFHSDYTGPVDVIDASGRRQWTRGIIVIGAPEEVTGAVPAIANSQIVPIPGTGAINAIRIGGYPALLVSDGASVRAARLLGSSSIAAARGLSNATVAAVEAPKLASDRVTFDQLGLAPASAEVYGRAEIGIAINTRSLPADTQLARLLLDIMVARDGAGEKAVVSIFVNERLVASAVAAQTEPTRIDIPLSEGLVETIANVRVVVQRRSLQGDCRFEPQGYPAQILGSSAVILTPAGTVHDFSDLATRWTNGVEVIVPSAAAERPRQFLGLLAEIISNLSPKLAPVGVKFVDNAAAASPGGPFLMVGALPPNNADRLVHFDRGRVAINDRSGRTLLDLGGFASGAVAQLIRADGYPGIWVRPLAADGALPSPPMLHLSRGNVAFIDRDGVALAMSTDRDTLIRVTYPDQVSWTTVAKRFQSWIVGALWLFATIIFLFALQRMRRRKPHLVDE